MASWRDSYPVHPAADLFPMMSPEELQALGEDIKQNGLMSAIVLWTDDGRDSPTYVLDGRNRLDAMEAVGIDTGKFLSDDWADTRSDADPWTFVVSANLRRRHLTLEQRVELHAALRGQGKSIREIAKLTGSSKSTVDRDLATVPDGTVPDRIVGLDGRNRPAALPRIDGKSLPELEPLVPDEGDEEADVRTVMKYGASLPSAVARLRDMAGQGYSAADMGLGRVAEIRKLAMENDIPLPGEGAGYTTFRVIRYLVSALDGTVDDLADLAHLDELDALVVSEWADSLTKSHRALGRLIKDMKGRGRRG